MTDYKGGRFWQEADKLTGTEGKTNLNSASTGGIVHKPVDGLAVDVTEKTYVNNMFVWLTFAGQTGLVLPANQASVYIYIDSTNTLQQSTVGFPASGFYVALAIATTSATDVILISNIQQVSPESPASSGVNSVSVTAPATLSGPLTDPVIGVTPATALVPGSMSSSDFSKLAGIAAGAQVVDQTNIVAAGGLHQSIITAIGNMLVGDAVGSVTELVPGALGTVLTSLGPGVLPQFQGVNAFTPQVIVAKSAQGAPIGLLPYTAAEWTLIASSGSIAVNATDPELIDINVAGLYLVVCMMASRQTNPVHNLQLNSPPNPGTKIGKAVFNKNRPGVFASGSLTVLGAFTGPQQLALQTTGTNFGTNGVDTTDPLENIIIVLKVAN